MKKIDFIMSTEEWLVRNDVQDFMCSVSSAKNYDIAQYIYGVENFLSHKAPDLLDDFYNRVKEGKVRGTSKLKLGGGR